MPTALTDTDTWVSAPDGPATGEPRTSTLIRSYMGKINNRVRWLFNRFADRIIGSFKLIESVDATANTITITGHGLPSNTVVRVESVGGTVPAGLSATVAYYVDVVDADTIKVSATSGPGAAVDITGTGTGTLYLYTVPDVLGTLLTKTVTISGNAVPATTVKALFALCMSTLGGTFSGAVTHAGATTFTATATHSNAKLVRSSAGGYEVGRTGSLNDAASQTISGYGADFYYCPDVGQNSTYTVSDPPEAGIEFTVSRRNVGGGFAAEFRREDASLMGTLPNTGSSWIRYKSHAEDGALAWHAEEWGGDADNLD